MTSNRIDRTAARFRTVEEHIWYENKHNLEGILSTFGETAFYEDQPWNERFDGLEEVRSYYEALISALPDLHIDVQQRHIADETVILELVISGTHQGSWRGLPATGCRIEFPLCAVYTFTVNDKLAGERIYYDRATVLRQVRMYHEPTTFAGWFTTIISHPITIARAVTRLLLGH